MAADGVASRRFSEAGVEADCFVRNRVRVAGTGDLSLGGCF